MYGDTPEEAAHQFLATLRQCVDCVTDATLVALGGGYHPPEATHRFILAGAPVPLTTGIGLSLKLQHHYRIIEHPGDLGPWRVTSVGYFYALDAAAGQEIVSYHWHPNGEGVTRRRPHLHLRGGAQIRQPAFEKVHFPTERIALEDFVLFAIEELGVAPRRTDWRETLRRGREAFAFARSWPASGPDV